MTSNSSNSSGGSGNTKQISPAKNWCFTLNNPTLKDFKEIIESEMSIVPRFVFQLECGETGTMHLQGYVRFEKKCRPKSVFMNKGIHWEKCRNIKKSIEYCQKEDTRVEGPWLRGFESKYVINMPYHTMWMSELEGVLDKEPDYRKIYWVYDKYGNAGKTLWQKWVFLNYDRVVVLSGAGKDMKNGIVEYAKVNECRLPKIVLINIPRSKEGFVSWCGLEEVKDMFFYSGKYEGGMVCGPNPHIIICANYYPPVEMMSRDRWEIRDISDKTNYYSNTKDYEDENKSQDEEI